MLTLALALSAAIQTAPLAPPPHSLAPLAAERTPTFDPPRRLRAGGAPLRTPAPGYAAPTLHDVDSDGHADLVVGQFDQGGFMLYPGTGDGAFGAGSQLLAQGAPATVPGVW